MNIFQVNKSMLATLATTSALYTSTTAIKDNQLTTQSTAFVYTNVTPDSSLSSVPQATSILWKRLVDTKLINWGRDSGLADDDEFQRPTKISVDRACQLAMEAAQAGVIFPTRVTPNADGGISIEWDVGIHLWQVEVLNNGHTRCIHFNGSNIVSYYGFTA